MQSAKFEATVVNFKTTGKKTIVQLELTNSAAARNYMFLVGALDKDVHVLLGDPQSGIEDYGVRVEHPGLKITTGPSGVVERVSKEDQEDDDQQKLELESEETETEQESDESETKTEETAQEDFELEYDDEKASEEVTEEEAVTVEVEGKDALENYILSGKAPKYDDIPYDFPELLKRKMKGETWMEIATSLKVSSTQLSAAWSKYRKNVKAYMEGEEHGAA